MVEFAAFVGCVYTSGRVQAPSQQVGLQVGVGLLRDRFEGSNRLLNMRVAHNNGQRGIIRTVRLDIAVFGKRLIPGFKHPIASPVQALILAFGVGRRDGVVV